MTKYTFTICLLIVNHQNALINVYMYRLKLHVAAELHPATFLQDAYSHSVVLTYSKFQTQFLCVVTDLCILATAASFNFLINFVSFNTDLQEYHILFKC